MRILLAAMILSLKKKRSVSHCFVGKAPWTLVTEQDGICPSHLWQHETMTLLNFGYSSNYVVQKADNHLVEVLDNM